jgi:ATP-dependent RNA helicase SUPV3L1/SUV3
VAFSRRDIFRIKQSIERGTPHGAAVVYGALPPETRRQQARAFNEGELAVMVASDAVGMGLNLNIGRIVFSTLRKRGGDGNVAPVGTSMIKQIAGRAGRRGTRWLRGAAVALDPRDEPRLREALDSPLEDLSTPKAGLFPEFEQLESYASGVQPDARFDDLLDSFARAAIIDGGRFFLCRQEAVREAAGVLAGLSLSLADSYSFCTAPASSRDPRLTAALLHYAARYARGHPVVMPVLLPSLVPANAAEMAHFEAAHQAVSLWLWLSNRFRDEEVFPGREKVEAISEGLCSLLHRGLTRMAAAAAAGKDVAEGAARPEVGAVLSCFNAELAALEEEQKTKKNKREAEVLTPPTPEWERGERRRRAAAAGE